MFKPVAFVLLLTGTALAGETSVADRPVPGATLALYSVSATLVGLASFGVSGLAGASIPSAVFDAQGRPAPLALAGGLAVALALHVTLVHLVVPELGRLANDGALRGDAAAARASGWRVSRWAAFAALAGLGLFTTGAALEHSSFGGGQWPMLAGAGVLFVASVVWTVLDAVFSWTGFVASRRAVVP